VIAQELARDVAVQGADTLLLTAPNQLGVEYNTRMLETDRARDSAVDRLAARFRRVRHGG
jgi:hypothetical protein